MRLDFLRRIPLPQLRQLSIAAAAITYSAIVAGLAPEIATTLDQLPEGAAALLRTLTSAVTLLALISGFQRFVVYVWAKPYLGEWVYESSSGNWGYARIVTQSSDLAYEVYLYQTREAIRRAVSSHFGAPHGCIGATHSTMVRYDGNNVELVYVVDNTDPSYRAREGILTLHLMPGGQAMKGYWRSGTDTGEQRTGVLNMVRASVMDFDAKEGE